MIYYMAAMGIDEDIFGNPDWDILDVPVREVNDRIEYADPDNVHWKAKKDNAIKKNQGYAVNPDTMPKRILWASGKYDVPDILPWFAVSPRFRDLVEQFEPGVHQFVPVDIYKERAGAPVATYYWFIVCQRIDSVDREHTTFAWKAPKDEPEAGHWAEYIRDPMTRDFIAVPNARLVFNNLQVAGHHIWNDPHILTFGDRLCSDAFGKAALAANFSGLRFAQHESI
jgi:hypothetical protein